MKNSIHNPLYGLILAGGKSSRMGRDKSSLVCHDGKDQVRYLNDVLHPFVDQVFVSIRKEQRTKEHLQGYQIIEDSRNIASPLNGILSAMDAFPTASWLVVAVDMPHIDAVATETLLQVRNSEKPATCFTSPVKGGPDPLFAIWEAHAKTAIETLVAEENVSCPRKTLTLLKAHIFQDGINPKALSNINTPEEYTRALT